MVELFTTENLVAFLTLTALEIVLGIDNVIFIAILSNKLPKNQQAQARTLGIALAVIARLVLLFAIRWIMGLTQPLVAGFSGRDLILLVGGLFLIGKSTYEIHEKLEGEEDHHGGQAVASLGSVLVQVILIDLVFSLDSVITAVGISGEIWVMVPAVLIAAVVMLVFANKISDIIERHPTLKMLALAFLIMIGLLLVMEGWNPEMVHDLHLKNYVYFAMAFSIVIELLNIRLRHVSAEPLHLRKQPTMPAEAE
ncbi:TerC family protein [Chloroflexi bacterium TSY]|nr:TerC family protein [Chloroflexi bacterium TSY]